MDAAFHRNEFLFIVALDNGRGTWHLGFVPLAIRFGQRVNVVRCLIAIDDAEFLIDMHGQNVRNVLTSLLLEGDGLRRDLVVVGGSGGNVNDYVIQAIVGASHDCFVGDRSDMLTCASRLFRHVDGFLFGGRASIGDLAGDCSGEYRHRANRDRENY